jgi:hypothetical protein
VSGAKFGEPENLDVAGFPSACCNTPDCHEWPESHEGRECFKCPEPHVCPVSPVSRGQGLEEELKRLAMANACTRAEDAAETKRFKLARDLAGLEEKIDRKVTPAEVRRACDEWERASLAFLDWGDEDHFAMLLAELTKVRVPTGQGDTINKALEKVSVLPDSDLPVIPGYPDAPKPWRKLAAFHREISRLRGGNVYFLSYRDAAKVCNELSPQSAHTLSLALERSDVIKIVHKGKPGLNSRKAAQFRYLLPLNGEVGATDLQQRSASSMKAVQPPVQA